MNSTTIPENARTAEAQRAQYPKDKCLERIRTTSENLKQCVDKLQKLSAKCDAVKEVDAELYKMLADAKPMLETAVSVAEKAHNVELNRYARIWGSVVEREEAEKVAAKFAESVAHRFRSGNDLDKLTGYRVVLSVYAQQDGTYGHVVAKVSKIRTNADGTEDVTAHAE